MSERMFRDRCALRRATPLIYTLNSSVELVVLCLRVIAPTVFCKDFLLGSKYAGAFNVWMFRLLLEEDF
jgi:hypothetical protein